MKGWEKTLVGPETSIRTALLQIDVAATQMALVVDGSRKLLGSLSDGDIRRGLIKGLQLSDPVKSCMYALGLDQSRIVATTLRSMPVGRGGLTRGNSPLAMRSLHSARYLVGKPCSCAPTCPIMLMPA